jgi:hemin uptake protein HemP
MAEPKYAPPPPRAGQSADGLGERRSPASSDARRWSSVDLFGTLSEIEIEHGSAVYRLRRTSLGKLILTK